MINLFADKKKMVINQSINLIDWPAGISGKVKTIICWLWVLLELEHTYLYKHIPIFSKALQVHTATGHS